MTEQTTDMVKRTPMQEVCETIASPQMAAKLDQALPVNVTLDRFVRVTLTAVQTNPELITADRGTLYNSVIRCAQDGLLPDGREAALVIFTVKGEKRVQYLPMIGGLRKVAAKHRVNLTAFVVYKEDDFDYQLGIDPFVRHKPPKLDEPRGEPIGAYAVATDSEGRKYLEVMSRQEIEQVRAVSRAATSQYGPWVNWWGEMARKTVGRRLFKQLPLADLDEPSARLLDAADEDASLPREPRMSLADANLSASIGATVPADEGPDDDVPLEGEVMAENGEPSLFVAPTVAADPKTRARETGDAA